MIDKLYLDKFLRAALEEDLGGGDITTMATIPQGKRAGGRYIAKESGILCGIDVVSSVFSVLGDDFTFKKHFSDGDRIAKGDIIAEVDGCARLLLSGERVGLNLLQHMSGIATRTGVAVDMIKGTGASIIDTRKTTPGLRMLEKYAVRCGGGKNHRFGLGDGVLIKDNHIAAAGSITAAVDSARSFIPHTLKIEVEVENFSQLNEALCAGVDIIMLDNMTCPDMSEAVRIVGGRALTEASGNMGDRDLAEVASTGVDFISIGALTHSVRALDISLKFKLL